MSNILNGGTPSPICENVVGLMYTIYTPIILSPFDCHIYRYTITFV